MKKLFIIIVITIFIVDACSTMLCAQTDTATGKIYFMGTPKGSGGNGGILIDSKRVCNLHGKHYFVYDAPAGKHSIAIQIIFKSNEIVINVEKGKSYYIQFFSQTSYNNVLIAKMISEGLANLILPSLKQDKSCAEDTANLRSPEQ